MEYPNYALILVQEAANLLNELALEAHPLARNSEDDSEVCFHLQQVKLHIAEARMLAARTPQVEPDRGLCDYCNEPIIGHASERYPNACAACIAAAESEPKAVLEKLLG